MTTIGRLITDALVGAGVEWAFTVPGESFLGILDALPAAGIKVVATRHEGGAAFMAEAVGQLTGKPAVVLGTRAVGAANMSIGIHTARANSTPTVAILGQVAREVQGREAFQEADLVGTFGALAKWAAQINDPADAPGVVGEAMSRMLSGRRGPVLLAVPEDVIDLEAASDGPPLEIARPPSPSVENARAVTEMLDAAARPAILAGGGVIASAGQDALVALSERLNVPVFAAWRRPTVFPNDHPHYLGMTGYGAPATVREQLMSADALLVIGCRLNEVASYDYRLPASATRWAHVDLAPRTAGHGLRAPDIALRADAKAFLEQALVVDGSSSRSAAREAQLSVERATFEKATTIPARASSANGVDPAHVVAVLQDVLEPDAILTTDAGNFGLWPARYFRFGRRNGFLGPTSGAMGYALPAAVAASLVAPDRQVVALCGDGGLAMTMNELETAVRTGARLVVIVFDNGRYGTIAMHQSNADLQLTATELGPIDFAAIARACGAEGVRVSDDRSFEPALRAAIGSRRPTVIHVDQDPGWITPDRFV